MGKERAQHRGRRRFVFLGTLFLIALIGSMAWLMRPPTFLGPTVPYPNGYDALLGAGRLVKGAPPAQKDANKAIDDELRAFLASNHKALKAAQAALVQKSAVPLGRQQSVEAHMEDLAALRQLGRVLTCQAMLARREGRASETLEAGLDLLRLSHAVSYGGLLADQLTGTALKRQAIDELDGPLFSKYSSADARRIIAELERLGKDREPVTRIADRDLNFTLARQGLQARAAYVANRKTLNGLRTPAIKAAESAESQSERRARLFLVRLALRAYALDHADSPQPGDLQALVPSYLTNVPFMPGEMRRLTLDDINQTPDTAAESARRE